MTTIKIYAVGPDQRFSGEIDADPLAPVPPGSPVPPPSCAPGESATLTASGWVCLPPPPEEGPPAPTEPPVPHSVSARQIRLALLAGGLLDDLETAMAGMSRAARIEWEFAGDVLRGSSLVEEARVALGRTQEQVDDLFRLGATL